MARALCGDFVRKRHLCDKVAEHGVELAHRHSPAALEREEPLCESSLRKETILLLQGIPLNEARLPSLDGFLNGHTEVSLGDDFAQLLLTELGSGKRLWFLSLSRDEPVEGDVCGKCDALEERLGCGLRSAFNSRKITWPYAYFLCENLLGKFIACSRVSDTIADAVVVDIFEKNRVTVLFILKSMLLYRYCICDTSALGRFGQKKKSGTGMVSLEVLLLSNRVG